MYRKFTVIALLLIAIGFGGPHILAQSSGDIELPDLGDSSSSIFSLQQEYELGRIWLMAFRNQVDIQDDPLLQSYLENFIYHLATFSELKDRRLDVVIINNPTINAFAVPGGVVGVNTGLFHYAENEAQFASVLAHELAHLSQRHFARRVEAQQRAAIPSLAGLLAGIVIAATGGGDAGIAAIAATQAASLQSQLRYSRQYEQEADRIGMQTLINADFDPNSMASMFEVMLQAYRYAGTRPPEFLLTHPVTESRVSDARTRARQLPKKVHTDSLDYQLMRVRAETTLSNNSKNTLKTFISRVGKNEAPAEADIYGLILAYLDNGQPDKAASYIAPLLRRSPQRIAYIIADSRIKLMSGNVTAGMKALTDALLLNPGNHPLTMALGKAYLSVGQAHLAEKLLQEHAKRRPNDPSVWYLLAETYGLAGNIAGVHQARAEYFVLNGVLDHAIQQLGYALPLVADNQPAQAKINGRIQQITELRKELEKL